MAVAKHFPGHGDTSVDSHKVLPTIEHDKNRLDSVELYPFKKYIDAGLSGMMVGHLNIPALDEKTQPSSLSEAITTGLLQNELGFSGAGVYRRIANERSFGRGGLLCARIAGRKRYPPGTRKSCERIHCGEKGCSRRSS